MKKNGEVVSSYIYDPNGFRVEKVGSKGKIHYVPLLNGEVGYRKEFSTNAEYSFIYVGIQHLARVNGVIGGSGKKFYYHNDHLGSALAVTDENGNKVVERDFTPFGERINTDVYDDEPRDIEEDESGFTGKDWDIDAGLYYYNARWYDPAVGRFISEDSVNDPNNPNEFVYVANNPIVNIDPTGHSLGNVINAVGKVSQALNLAAELNPDLKGVASAFSKFAGALSNVRDFVMGARNVFGQKDIKVTKDKVIVKTADGGEKIYDKKKMKTDFQKLAQLQQDKSEGATKFETEVKDEYKDYFDTVRAKNGVTVIGLRGWGVGTKTQDTEKIKGEKNTYDDMLLTIDEKGNLDSFSRVNFEGTTATGTYGDGNTLDGNYPKIADGTYELQSCLHGSYRNVILTYNGSYDIPTIEENPQHPGKFTARSIEIHKGGSDWTWSKGCITIYAPKGDTSRWDRFIANFPDKPIGTEVGTFHLMTL